MKVKLILITVVILLLSACGEKIPKTAMELFNRAEKHRQAKETEFAINDLKLLVQHFSGDNLVTKSQYIIGDIYMNDLRDFEQAIKEYRKVIDDFDNAPEEPHARFMIGYIYSNILSQFEKAKIEYEAFLGKFPDHELAPSVRFELQYLGKDINEIEVLKNITS
ncbi:MAG: tetratricopeptide repeat protein [Candidatus Neomarinimicrobiota bacterium]